MNFHEIENNMIEALQNPEMRKMLPLAWQNIEWDVSSHSNTRTLIRFFAYHLEQAFLKEKNK